MRFLAVFLLISVFVIPSLVARTPSLVSTQKDSSATLDSVVQPIKIDPQLTQLMNNNTTSDVKVIVVFKDEAGVSSIERSNGLASSFRLITTFTIIPAALIEGPANKISELFSNNQISSLYLNKEIDLNKSIEMTPVTTTAKSTGQISSTSNWIQAINSTPSNVGNGSGVIVAVCDSGINDTLPDLAGKVIADASFVNTNYGYPENESYFDSATGTADDLGHGTYVAGIIAGSGIPPESPGVAPNAKLISAKCIDQFGEGFTAGIILAIQWANATGANVINLSLGGGSADPDDPMSLAVDAAVRSGVVVVSAAGNSGPDYSTGGVPGAATLGIAVGAANGTNSIASFSSRGPTLDGRPYPDVVAPGVAITSDLARPSAIADYADLLGYSTENNVTLDGTSAATPMVSGAAALLLSATGLRQLNRSTMAHDSLIEIATAIKIALMSTAKSLGADVNTQGSGMIDIYSAYKFLQQFGYRTDYSIVKVSPSALIDPPNFIGYLGDSLNLTVSIMTASKMTLTVVSSGNATSLIRFSNLTLTNIVGQTSLNVTITIPVNTALGRYTAQIGFENNTSLLSNENVSVSFNVSNPKGRIYLDLFHTDPSFSIESTFYKFGSMLENSGYDIYEGNNPITYSEISQYNILILADPLVMFSVEEVNAIHEFVQNNGSLLVLGNDYPDIASEAVNNITAQYGIQYTRSFTAIYSDLVFADLITQEIDITNLSTHPVTTGVSKYLFGYGSTLSVSSPAVSVAFAPSNFNSSPVLAVDQVTGGGRVVATGSLQFATDELLDPSYPGNLRLAENIVDWLVAGSSMSIEIIANETRLKANEPFQLGIAISNTSNGKLMAANTTCSAIAPTSIPIKLANQTNGIYYNTSVTLQNQGLYMFEIDVKIPGQEIKRTFQIEVINNPPQITSISAVGVNFPSASYPLPTYLEGYLPPGTPIIDRYGDYANITIIVTGLNPTNSNVTVYLTRSPTFYLPNDEPLNYFALSAVRLNSTAYNATFKPTPSDGADIYIYWVLANNNSFTSSFNGGGAIMVASIDPQISNSTTTVNSEPLSQLRQQVGTVLELSPVTASVGSSIPIVVGGSDVEESASNMKAWAVLLEPDLYIVPGIPYAELIVSELSFDSATSTFRGNLSIPASGVAYIPGIGAPDLLVNRLFYIMIVLANSKGAYATDFAAVDITPLTHPIPALLIFLILAASIAVPLVIIALIELRTRKKVKEAPVFYPSSPQPSPPPSPEPSGFGS